MGDLPGCGCAAAGGRAGVIRPLLPLPICPCPTSCARWDPEPAGNPLSGSLGRREAGIRASRDHGEGGRVLERRAQRRSRTPRPARLVPRGARPPASCALCFLPQFRRREALAEALARRGETGRLPSLRLPRAPSAAAASPAGPALAARTAAAPVSSWQTRSFPLKL